MKQPRASRTILSIDVGGTHIKLMTSTQRIKREFASGPNITARSMVAKVREITKDWKFDVISIGYPGPVVRDRPTTQPYNLGRGWKSFDFGRAFKRPTKVVNDALMQALGSYKGGKMLFLGLGTGLGSAMIVDGALVPMELGHLPYRKQTFEDYVGAAGLKRHGKKKWERYVDDVVQELVAALVPDYVVIGGGNAGKLEKLPAKARLGRNANAFLGGFRLWEQTPVKRLKKRSRSNVR
jgi:polyphosphate glucokinase